MQNTAAPQGSRHQASLKTWLTAACVALGSGVASSPLSSAPEPMVRMTTSAGVIDIVLFPKRAPITVENFLRYVDEGFFDGTIFHRVIPDFVIQGGGFRPGMQPRQPHPPIQNEAHNGLKNRTGTLSMARTNDPHSATSQFFINLKDNNFLDYQSPANSGYAVFAEVRNGMDTVRAIEKVATGSNQHHRDVPIKDVVIHKAHRLQ